MIYPAHWRRSVSKRILNCIPLRRLILDKHRDRKHKDRKWGFKVFLHPLFGAQMRRQAHLWGRDCSKMKRSYTDAHYIIQYLSLPEDMPYKCTDLECKIAHRYLIDPWFSFFETSSINVLVSWWVGQTSVLTPRTMRCWNVQHCCLCVDDNLEE